MYLGIEIGGTKLQVGVGPGDGTIAGLWRGRVDASAGAAGIRERILRAIPETLQSARVAVTRLKAAGVGFGGPINDSTGRTITSHQIAGWDDFPLPGWLSERLGIPCAMGNDADVAGLAEAVHGAGKGLSPLFYITIGSGIGGGFIIDGHIFRAAGRGAAEIGHLRLIDQWSDSGIASLEAQSSGWGIARQIQQLMAKGDGSNSVIRELSGSDIDRVTTELIGIAYRQGDAFATKAMQNALKALAEAIATVIALNCPRRIAIGGGVSLLGDALFFEPLRRYVAERVFRPFAGLTDIVPAALGEAVVVHGALALARSTVC